MLKVKDGCIPRITYCSDNKSVHILFDDEIFVHHGDETQRRQIGFAAYSITLYEDQGKLPKITYAMHLYPNISVSVHGNSIRFADILAEYSQSATLVPRYRFFPDQPAVCPAPQMQHVDEANSQVDQRTSEPQL